MHKQPKKDNSAPLAQGKAHKSLVVLSTDQNKDLA